jgi:uncharacterized protein VirK/YbjX
MFLKIEPSKRNDFPNLSQEAFGTLRLLSGLCARMGIRRSMVFLSRFACKPVFFIKWFRFLSDFTLQHDLSRPDDELVRKKTYKFFASGLPRNRGFDLLVDHFNLAQAALSRELLVSLWSGQPVSIGTVAGKNEAYELSMCLCVYSGTNHEGAFSIKLIRQSDQLALVNLSFILYKLDNCRFTVAIGGLQGSSRKDAKRAFIDATRDMCGLRPKDAVILVMEGLAMSAGADHFLAVSDIKHAINFRIPKNRIMKYADLDNYWTERGGKAGGEFGFMLPVKNYHLQSFGRRDTYKIEFLGIGKNLLAKQPQ